MRKFGNGTKEETHYNKAGRITVKTQKNSRGELLWGEEYIYGDGGKRTATVSSSRSYNNEKGPMMANVGGSDKEGLRYANDAFRGTFYKDGNVKFYYNSEQKIY